MSWGLAIEREVVIDATPEAVFRMFTDPAKLASWLGMSADLDPRPGGRFRFEIAPGEYCSGEYVTIEPPNRIAFTWGWESGAIPVAPGSSLVEIELASVDGGTLVQLTHGLLPQDAVELHRDGWRQFLNRLAAIAEGRDPGPDPARERPEQAMARLAGEE